jgi:hypothetical protein
MNPLIAVALADLSRAEDVKEGRALGRRRRSRLPLEAVKRDNRWASAIARWSKAEDPAPATIGCATVGCATA